MERSINTLYSADSKTMMSSTTPSDDEDDADDHDRCHVASSDFTSLLEKPGVGESHEILQTNLNDNDSLTTDTSSCIIQPSTSTTTIDTVPSDTCINFNPSNNETSLVQPLIAQNQIIVPIYSSPVNHVEERIRSSSSSTDSNDLNVRRHRFNATLYFTDMLISAFIITPFINIHWRGAWDLLDIHLLPDRPSISALISMGIGYAMLYTLYLTQEYTQKFYEKHRHDIIGLILTRSYTLVLALAYINQWRGLWNLLDLTSNQWYHLAGEAVIGIGFTLALRSVYNLNSAPFIIGIDTDSYFLLDSKVTITTNRFIQHTFDFFYYEFIEAPLMTLAWRGLYNLSDNYIYPDNRQLSMIVSFASGYALFFILAFIQVPIVRYLLERRYDSLYSLVTTLFHLLAFLSVVQIWRSLWIICEQYLNIPEYHNTTLWLCYGASFAVLTCGLAACSLNGPGGSKDSYIDDGFMLIFKFDYFTTLLSLHRTNETEPNQASSHSGIILWLLAHVLKRKQRRRNTLVNQSTKSTVMSTETPPSASERAIIN